METVSSRVIITAISFLSIIVIIWLFLHYSKNYEKEKPKTRILYIFGYLLLIIIGLIEYICLGLNGNNDEIINYISFGSTLSSLVMSVVAIIFTIVSGRNNEEQLGKISQATKELQQTASSIDRFREISDKLNVRIDEINNKLSAIHRESQAIHEGIDNVKNDITKQSINAFISTKDLSTAINKKIVNEEDNIEEFSHDNPSKSNHDLSIDLESFYTSISYSGAIILLACVYAKNAQKQFNTKLMGSWFMGENLAYMLGFLIATSAIGLVEFEGSMPDITVTKVDDEMELRASIIVSVVIRHTKDKNSRDNLIAGFNEMRKYFDLPPIPLKDTK